MRNQPLSQTSSTFEAIKRMPFFGWLAQTPRMIRLARVASTGVHISPPSSTPPIRNSPSSANNATPSINKSAA